ncbi:hypothetical protein [Acidovorax sp. Leaf160]|uniref:hypothetical protein n=1 Tax=Acidovorax sp. Leaf160 TaxID=1736280 RepID=UPI0006F8B04F|nr:hypothetical protein [Acidovorax sp. Leaf160]KQR62627.1 hypothetical protein ASF94_15510 [Acidovorax sp. Leaf160]
MATTEERNQQVLAVLNAASEPIGPTEIAYRVRRDWAYNSAPIVPVLRRIGAVRHPGGRYTKPEVANG